MRARTTVASGSSALAHTARAGSGLGGSDVPTEIEHGGARAGSAQLTYRDVSASGGLGPITDATALCCANEPACSSSGIRKSAREH